MRTPFRISRLNVYSVLKVINLIILIFGIQSLYAVTITGRVIDPEDNSGVQGAECQLKKREKLLKNTLSNDDGYFSFDVEIQPTDSVYLTIIAPGYERYDSMLPEIKGDINLGNCTLPLTKMLTDLIVEGENVRRVGANILMTPMESQINISVRANDLLNNMAIPGLRISADKGDITMPGYRLVILVNGIPADQTQLKTIPANEIVSVEYSPIVPPAFSNLGDFMINIRTKKHESGGNFNTMETVALNFPETTTILSLTLNKGASKFKIDGYFHYRDFRHVSDIEHQEFKALGKEFSVITDMSQPFNTKVSQASLEYTYNPDESLLFVARGNFVSNYYKINSEGQIDDSLSGEYNVTEKVRDDNRTPSLEAYFSKTFNHRSMIELDVVGTYSYNNYAYSNVYSGGIERPQVGNITDSKRYSLISTAGYNHKLSDKTQLSFTWQNLASHTRNEYPQSGDTYTLVENNNSFMLYLQQTIGKVWLGLKPGIKYSIIKQEADHRNFIYPSADVILTYAPSSHFNLTWQTKYSTPDFIISNLVPTPLWDSNYLYTIGNPDLKMEKLLKNRVMLNYTVGSLRTYFSGTYNRIYDIIYKMAEYDSSISAFCNRYLNGKAANGVSLHLGGGYYNFLNMFSLQGEIEYRHLSMIQDGYSFAHNTLGGYINLSWRYKQFGLIYHQLFPAANMDINLVNKEGPASIIVAEYRPDSHWTIQLMGAVYNKRPIYRFSYMSPLYSCDETRDFLKDSNMIRLSISYDLSWGRKYNSTRDKSINISDENSAIAKKPH